MDEQARHSVGRRGAISRNKSNKSGYKATSDKYKSSNSIQEQTQG